MMNQHEAPLVPSTEEETESLDEQFQHRRTRFLEAKEGYQRRAEELVGEQQRAEAALRDAHDAWNQYRTLLEQRGIVLEGDDRELFEITQSQLEGFNDFQGIKFSAAERLEAPSVLDDTLITPEEVLGFADQFIEPVLGMEPPLIERVCRMAGEYRKAMEFFLYRLSHASTSD